MERERPRWEKGPRGQARRAAASHRGSGAAASHRESGTAARALRSPTDARVMETAGALDPLQNGQLSFSGISILDRLIKTCPVWLQLCMGAPQVVEILCREASGVFLVTRDAEVQCMVLWVRFSDEAADVLRYNIREEKTMMFLEGSMLVFKDIFKLVAFYCISRDILPSVLKLPPAISGAPSLRDLEEISNLGTGFWDTDKPPSVSSQPGNLRSDHSGRVRQGSRESGDCTCEIEISAGSDRLWFVTPIFIEDCSNVDTSDKLPLTNCIAKPKIMHRRPPPPPPPTLHKPPLPSVPPSAPPPNYIRPQSDSCAIRSPTRSRPSTSERESPAAETTPTEPPTSKTTPTEPPTSKTTPTEPPTSKTTPTEPPTSKTLTEPTISKTSTSQTLTEPSTKPPTSETPESAVKPPTSGTLSELPTSKTPTEPPPLETSSKPPLAHSPTSETPTQCSSPQSLDLSPPIHNLVDLLDHPSPSDLPIGSPPPDLTPVLSPDPLSPTKSSLHSSLSTSFPSETDCPLLASHPKDHQAEASPVLSLDVDLLKEPLKTMKINASCKDSPQPQGPQTPTPVRAPPAVPRRRPSGKVSESNLSICAMKDESEVAPKSEIPKSVKTGTLPKQQMEEHGKKTPPVPPPRKKKLTYRSSSVPPDKSNVEAKSVETEKFSKTSESQNSPRCAKDVDRKASRAKRVSTPVLKTSDRSLLSHGSDPAMATPEADSYSTSSADEDAEPPASSSIKKSHSFMLDRAKNRLSIVAITNVFSAFMSADRKLQKKITELAHDKDSYFGNLVQDYKAYSLEMMAKQSSSTEMLQEIRLMMTQLKSYLVQSTELKAMVDYSLYTDDKIDAIVEAALCKCVLKPLKSPIECYLREIHNKDGSLRLLTENQQVIQETTTTDLGVTTSVPDSGVMEKILHKFGTMHKTYSPEKKITYLLKACKLIYDSMAAGNPGKHHGADDFLPVLMYVLAQCDLVALLLDVEYMMELMDPALQLGEGSYYLTTTYGALEHIKNYDKITVTRQLSVEVQDSIHRWERRRTLNKAKVSRSSIQDFITISFEELDSKTRTLATKPDMNVAEVVRQCAEKFEVSEPENYGLFVLVDERCVRLTEDAFPQQVKSRLLKNEQKLDFHFLYRRSGAEDTVMRELDFL